MTTIASKEGQATSRGRLVLLACSVQFLVVLDVSLVTVAVPSISQSLALDPLTASWVLSGYTVTLAALLLLGGRLSDMLGPRRALAMATGLFVVAAVAGAVSVDGGMLIAARVGQGAAAAVLAPTSLAVLQGLGDDRARLRAVAAWSATSSVGGALGAVFGGVLLAVWPWPAVLLFEGGLALLALVGSVVFLRPRSRVAKSARFDALGAVALSATLAASVVALVQVGTVGVQSPWFWAAAAVAVVGGATFAVRHRRSPEASLLPPLLLGTARVTAANTVMFFAAASCFPIWYLLSLALQGSHGFSAFVTGLCFLAPSGGVVVGSLAVPLLGRRLSSASVVVVAAGLAASGAVALVFLHETVAPVLGTVLPSCLLAGGMGMMFTTLTSTATRDLPPESGGAAAGAVNASRQLGSAVGLAAVTVAFAHTASLGLAFAVLAVTAVAVMGVALLVRRSLNSPPRAAYRTP